MDDDLRGSLRHTRRNALGNGRLCEIHVSEDDDPVGQSFAQSPGELFENRVGLAAPAAVIDEENRAPHFTARAAARA